MLQISRIFEIQNNQCCFTIVEASEKGLDFYEKRRIDI